MNETQTHTTSQEKLNIHPVIRRLLEKRGLDELGIAEFLSWDLKAMPDLTNMLDMQKAAQRIISAITNGERIGIYGDYDVDGTTSCALFHHFFEMVDVPVDLIQPSRFVEGYGLHPSSIDKAIEMGIEVLITVDCGISNNEAAEYAGLRGLDLIITDHHKDARETMPEAYAIVNPNRRDEPADSPLKVLAGVGVAFAICWEVKKQLEANGETVPSLYPLLQWVAMGTVCDMAPLTPLNLKLVRHGLKQMHCSTYPGVLKFFTKEEREAKFVPSEKLGFNIGPLINSKGRLDHPEMALECLIAKDLERAQECYSHLEISNRERKIITSEVFKSASEQVLKTMDGDEHLVSMVYDSEWHEGVVGIVASRLVETYKAPALVFTDAEEKGIVKASCRSAGDLDLFSMLKAQEHLFVKFGGHKAAAGLSMPKENLAQLRQNLTEYLKQVPSIERTVQDYYDLEIEPHEINPRLLKELEMLEPFGMGNEKPLFRVKGLSLASFDLLKEVHVRWNFKSTTGAFFKGISFNYVDKFGVKSPDDLFDASQSDEDLYVYCQLAINRYRGNEYIQLMVNRIETE
ncbi:MAG: single-stranded-DNA-specific exonuclease RecJ [Halobacteriovorax sp.]|nr:single-stranded-DNA-specific exonuclease RecJ [Halobacteriovorax sp.]|tara:strand:+ start:124844 stop:126562 length:1719 start_codon:yes stop_codon:yes gene_type:complete